MTHPALVFRCLHWERSGSRKGLDPLRKIESSRIHLVFALSLAAFTACGAVGRGPTPQTTLQGSEGGQIVYGAVSGATTQPAAMAKLLRAVQAQCGDKPQIGRVFRFRGTNSVGVFFSVTNHPQGDQPLAGLVIASASGADRVEAALLSDAAPRFGKTVNPMLRQLFAVWHPDAMAAPAGQAPASGPAPALHRVVLPDRTASVGLPAEWRVDPKSGGGTMLLHGPRGEVVILNSMFLAQDPNGPASRNQQRMGMRPLPGTIVYPANADLVKNFAPIIERLSRSKGFVPAGLKLDYAEEVAAPAGCEIEGERWALATGEVDPDGKGPQRMFRVLGATRPDPYGDFSFHDFVAYFPHSSPGQANTLAAAIFSSFQMDLALVAQRASAEAAPHIAHLKQVDAAQRQAAQANAARIIGNIQQIGANATARMNAVGAANDAQHAQWHAGQDANARNTQAVSNYLLDQSVVQDNNMYGNGTLGHGTLWNATADALVKADPNRFEYVDKPNYWKGTDYH